MSGIRVELELDDGSFTTRMIHAGETVAQFNRNVGQAYVGVSKFTESNRDLLGTLRDVSVTLGTAGAALNAVRSVTTGWIGDIVKANAEIQKTQVLLKGMSKAADPIKDAAEQMNQLRQFAKESPYSLQVLTKTFVQMKATGTDPMKGSLQGLVDAVSAMGGSGEVMGRAALAMTQMAGKGVIQMEELRQQLGEAVPRAAELMARSMGVSYAELVKAISTGTVEAKPALELLRLEFDRTFGGSAKANMETYDGLVSRIGTSLQDLKLVAGGQNNPSGFFGEVQRQLKDLLAALNSAQATDFAQKLGDGLTTAILAVRQAIEFVARFKNEIIDLGKAIAIAFAVSRTISAVQAMGTAIAGVGTQITMMRAQWQANVLAISGGMGPIAASTAALNAHAAAQARSITTGATFGDNVRAFTNQLLGLNPVLGGQATLMQRLYTSTNLVGSAARFAAVGFAVLGTTMNFIVGWLPLLVTGIMLAGEKWGWFKDRAAEARGELTKFGATGQQQVKDAFDATIEQKENELKNLQKVIAYNRSHYNGVASQGVNALNDKQASDLEKEINGLKVEREKQMGLAIAAEQKKRTDEEMAELARARTGRSQNYDQAMTQMENAYKEERARLIKAKESTAEIDTLYRTMTRERQRAFYEVELKALDDYIQAQNRIAENAWDTGIAAQAKANLSEAKRQADELKSKIEQFDATNPGIPTLDKAANEQKAIDKIAKEITSAKARAEGLRAELAGGSSEAAKLVYELENSDKIPKGNPAIKQMIADLKEAIEINDRLEKALKGKQDLERDIQNAAKKALEERFELEHGHLTESEKIIAKAQAGLYGPMTGDSKSAATAVAALNTAQGDLAGNMDRIRALSATVGDALKGAFGENTKSALERATKLMAEMAGSMERLKQLSEGLDINKPFTTLQAGSGALQQFGLFGLGGPQVAMTGSSNRDIDWAVRTILSEAGNQGEMGMAGVAAVIKNRAAISGRSLSEIVTAPKQFEPWNTNEGKAKLNSYDPSSAKYQEAERILRAILSGAMSDPTGGADSFANRSTVAARGNTSALEWIDGMREKRQIGDHLFGKAGYGGRKIDQGIPRLSPEYTDELIRTQVAEAENAVKKANKDYSDMLKNFGIEAEDLAKDASSMGSRVKALNKSIRDGKNPDHPDEKDPYWDKLRAAAQAADEAEKTAHENEARRRKGQSAKERMGQSADDIAELRERARRQLEDPYSYKNSDAYLAKERGLRRQVDDRVKGGEDRATVQAEASAQLQQFVSQDIEMKTAGFKKENDALRQSLSTQYQSRQEQLANQIKLLDSYLASYEAAGGKEVEVTNAIEQRKALLRQAAAQAGPIGKQMQEWSDWGNNMEKAATGWMSSFTDQFAEMVTTGKGDFASLTQSIIKDIIKMGLQWSMSSIFKSFMGGGGGVASAATGGDLFGGLFSKLFGAAHTGGMVSSPPMQIAASPLAFLGAPRFHTGGVLSGLGIGPDEVPIIAKKGEGVFTKEQMAAMGDLSAGGPSAGMISIAPTINLHASGGTDAQNADLAAKVGKQIDGSVRAIVVDVLRQQMRPNGMLNRG